MEIIQVDELCSGKRLDVVLTQHNAISSRSEASRLIKNGYVQINSSFIKIIPKRITKIGDIISFTPRQSSLFSLEPIEYKLDIIYEDEDLIVINKPKGMVVHPAPGHPTNTLVNYLLFHTKLSETKNIYRPRYCSPN